jgi:hypothetical protein
VQIRKSVLPEEITIKQVCVGRVGLIGGAFCVARGAGGPVGGALVHVGGDPSSENSRNVARPGEKGELGAYQFRESTWPMATSVLFSRALDWLECDWLAVRDCAWLRRGLEGAGLTATA